MALGSPREGAEHPVPKDAGALEVAPNPADNLQAEIAYGVFPDFLIEDHVLDPLTGFEQSAIFDLSIELAKPSCALPSKSPHGQ